jgi:hypothetical protein
MDTSDLRRSELVGAIAAVILILSLFVPWFDLAGSGVVRDEPEDWVCGVGDTSCNGFDTFPILRWLLIAAAAAPLILTYLVVSGTETSYPRGEFTAVVGMAALVLIGYNGFVDKPSANDIGVSLTWGYFLALFAALGILAAGAARSIESGGGAQRKPPATF